MLFVLIICGFGVPIPEDITLVSGGVIVGLYPESVNSHLMLVVSMIGVLAGDSTMYWLGRILRHSNSSFPPNAQTSHLRTSENGGVKNLPNTVTAYYLSPVSYQAYAHQFIWFLALPVALATPRFVLIDFCAAIISVPIWFTLANLCEKFRLVTRAN